MIWRIPLLVVQAFVAVTAAAGGIALMAGAAMGWLGITPEPALLADTPFGSYAFPGLVLIVVVGGTQALAFVLLWRQNPWAMAAATVAGFGLLIWIFVQQAYIPFTPLQAVYFGLGLLELVLVLLTLDLFNLAKRRLAADAARMRRSGSQTGSRSAPPGWSPDTD